MSDRKIFDCFCYFNEDMLLGVRLALLWDVVDTFVIVESKWTHSGQSKPLYFNISKFKKYESKIRYVISEDCPGGAVDFWVNENHQRNQICKGLTDAVDQDWILISDLDEIPNPVSINTYNPSSLRGDFEQEYFAYFFNNKLVEPKNDSKWLGSKITTYKTFRGFFNNRATNVRSYKSSGPLRSIKRSFFKAFQRQVIPNGGWHFTWINTLEKIALKVGATAHGEIVSADTTNLQTLQARIENGLDIFVANRRYQPVNAKAHFPPNLFSRLSEWPDFFRSYNQVRN